VLAGQLINYTIIVENLGPAYAYNVSIRDEILSSGTFTLIDAILDPNRLDTKSVQPSPNGGMTLEFYLNEPLEPKNVTDQGRWVIQITIRANETQDINDVVNVFTKTLRTLDPDLSNNEAQCSIHVTAVADLQLTKTDNPDPVVTSQSCALNYTLVVKNNGPSTAVNVVCVDPLPADLTIKSISVSKGSFNAGVPGDPSQPTVWAIGSLAPGESATMTINTTMPQTIDPQILRNDARVYSDTLDTDNSNNLASQDTKVVHYLSQLKQLNTVADNQLLSPATIALISLATLTSLLAAISVFKRTTIRRFIGFIRAKKE
jgi:uncharacterized repeat protein (TIGR01451 family)